MQILSLHGIEQLSRAIVPRFAYNTNHIDPSRQLGKEDQYE